MASKKDLTSAERLGAMLARLAVNSLAIWGITAILGLSLSFWAVVGVAVLAQVLIVSTTLHLAR